MEDDEIERQLKCKICDDVVHFWVLQGAPYKGEIQLDDGNFAIFKNNYLGLCVSVCMLLAAFKCPNAQICVLWP
jgi:hypothetical protein